MVLTCRDLVLPGPVAKPPSFCGSKARGESSEQQRGGQPESKSRTGLARAVDGALGLRNNLGHTIFGLRLIHSRECGDYLRQISSVCRENSSPLVRWEVRRRSSSPRAVATSPASLRVIGGFARNNRSTKPAMGPSD